MKIYIDAFICDYSEYIWQSEKMIYNFMKILHFKVILLSIFGFTIKQNIIYYLLRLNQYFIIIIIPQIQNINLIMLQY
ncbi:unnamed protein product [Paramecium sonneborni]|uniref:Uncharacterized protein n=1 Tax=Paramecium sonneborni TaxID=65129 RepID=A0A8S1M6L2_9CILI|nr:unnamed protein product [Paramecium sonneborni]